MEAIVLIALLVKASAVLGVALLVGALLRRQASRRHGAWTAVFVALIALPALGLLVPAVPLPILSAPQLSASPPSPPIAIEGVTRLDQGAGRTADRTRSADATESTGDRRWRPSVAMILVLVWSLGVI